MLRLVTRVYSVCKGAVSWVLQRVSSVFKYTVFTSGICCTYRPAQISHMSQVFLMCKTDLSFLISWKHIHDPGRYQLLTTDNLDQFLRSPWWISEKQSGTEASLSPHTGKSHFMSGIHSCKMSHKLKLCKSNTKFIFKTAYFLGVRGFTTSSYVVYCTSRHTNVWSMYVLFILYTYISILDIYLFIIQWTWKRPISVIFGTVHCDGTVVVLLHKHLSSWLSTLFNFVCIITNCTYANMSEYNITAYVNNLFTFFQSAYYV